MRILHRHPSISFMAQPTNQSLLGFENQIKKHHGEFGVKIIKSELLILRPKPENHRS
jgi:hypothetical protein